MKYYDHFNDRKVKEKLKYNWNSDQLHISETWQCHSEFYDNYDAIAILQITLISKEPG
jgi:hypothetical protein